MKWAQGGCTDGTYLYQFMISTDSTKCVIVKIDLATETVVGYSAELDLGHANDAAYNPYDDTIAVADCYYSYYLDDDGVTKIYTDYYNTVYILDAQTLTLEKTVIVDTGYKTAPISAITYDVETRQYITSNETQLYFWNEDFSEYVNVSSRITDGYATQGIDCDGEYIYRLAYRQDSETKAITNHLVINDMSGNKVADIDLGISVETENIIQYNGKFYVTCNNSSWNGSEVYSLTLTNI